MNILIYLIIGALVGWVASRLMGTDRQQGLLLNIVVGIVGAFVAGWLISPLLGISTINEGNFSLPALLVSLGGAVILLAVINLFRRGGLNTHR
jgi:uncharacterized membrane protein YeaQ/YmgE (transglycosylase-associated protein family)